MQTGESNHREKLRERMGSISRRPQEPLAPTNIEHIEPYSRRREEKAASNNPTYQSTDNDQRVNVN